MGDRRGFLRGLACTLGAAVVGRAVGVDDAVLEVGIGRGSPLLMDFTRAAPSFTQHPAEWVLMRPFDTDLIASQFSMFLEG